MNNLELNKIYCESNLETMARMPDNFVDLSLCDPPYGINLKYADYDDSDSNWYDLMIKVMPELIRVSKMVILPSTQIKRLKWFYDNFPPDWVICWYKGSVGHASYIGFNDWEPHLVYGRTKNQLYMHDFFKTKSSPKLGTFGHPCPKPKEWSDWLINKATEEGDLVYDAFMGSGTTALTCVDYNRNFIGSEITQEYVDIANKRLEPYFSQQKLF